MPSKSAIRRTMPLAALALAAVLASPAAASLALAGTVRPTAEDFVKLASPGDLAWSPDGRLAAFALSRAVRDTSAKPSESDKDGGWKRERQIVLLDLATRVTRTLTTGTDRSSTPRFSPDGRTLGFVRKSGEKSALWLLPLAGGEARRLDTGKLEPGDYRFSPDGSRIAFTAEPAATGAETDAKWRSGGTIAWDEEWKPTKLWMIPTAGGDARTVSPDTLHIVEFEWSPNGREFAVVTSPNSDPYQASSFLSVRRLDAQDGRVLGTLERANDSYGHTYRDLHWTPDGRSIVCLGLNGGLSNVNALLVWDVGAGTVRDIAGGRDRTFEGIALGNGGRDVIANVAQRTESRFVRFPLAGGAPQDLGFAGRVTFGTPLADAAGRSLLFVSSSPSRPSEVQRFDTATKRADVLTDLNAHVSDWALGETEVVRWTCPEGVELEGLLTRPAGARAGEAAPLVEVKHGFPDAVTPQSWSSQVQDLASHGYAVFRPNYRGGTAYGFDFYAANRGRFGEIEQMDIESGVDALVQRGAADPNRLFYGGWSWGGYLTAWTIGHVQRYKAAVVGAGVNDVTFSYSSSDINHGVGPAWEYKGDPWRQTEQFDRASPLRYAKHMKTPTLVLHGQSDDRVHFQNGVALYRALSDVGCEVKFFAYPREPHGFQEPAHLVHRLDAWRRWYDTHGGAEAARP